jgi:PAS domain S-box-containing protein
LKARIYTLKDIEKILTFIPPIFIILLAFVIYIVGFIILEYRQDNEIRLITQKIELENNFHLQNTLKKYLQDIHTSIQKNLNTKEVELKDVVHILSGITKGIGKYKTLHVEDLKEFLLFYENTLDIHITIFDKNYKILYGKKPLQNIEKLIFSQTHNPKLLKITLMYIASQGTKTSFRWKDDIQKTIQLSYFETCKNNLRIGAFSSLDSLRKITKQTILKTITENKDKKYYLWFYDDITKQAYNLKNKRKWQISKRPSSTISHYFKKYFFNFALEPIKQIKQEKEITAIKKNFQEKKNYLFTSVLIATVLLIFITTLFSSFIKKIFSSYNKRLEHKNRLLKLWKERFELAVIASNDGLWDTDFETGKTFFSKKWLDMLGYKPGDITSYEEWFELIHKDDRTLVHNTLSEHINNQKEHIICEYRLKTKYNSYKWLLARGKVFLNEDKSPQRLLMMSMDIDEEKRLEKDLKDTELLVSEGEIIALRVKNSKNLEVLFISKSIKIFGYIYEDFFQRNVTLLDIIHPDDKDEFIASLHAYMNQGFTSFSKSYRIVTKSSEIRWVLNRMLFIKDDFGNITNLYGYIYDITALKQGELELEKRVKQEVTKNNEKQKLLIQQNKLAAMGEMIGSIAHQWRQPLNNISLILHFLKDNYQNISQEEFQSHTQKAKKQLEYMSQTIDDFRNFYKPSKQKTRFSVLNAIQKALSIINSQLEKNMIAVKINEEDFAVLGYENEFKQAILNILSNAIEAIKESHIKNGTIDIEVQKSSISISNNGGNATDEVLDRMFEPYFTTKFEDKGTGIGLYMTKTIIESMKGSISVSNLQNGIRFSITI